MGGWLGGYGGHWTVSTVSVSQVLRLRMSLVQVVVVVLGVVIKDIRGQDYGPVNLDTVDPLSLSWNQIHWLVKDQIKEVEELKAEHDEIYNEITGGQVVRFNLAIISFISIVLLPDKALVDHVW